MADYTNTSNSTVITASDEADIIFNSGATVTVYALGGDDTINSTGSKVTIDAGKGNDSIYNFASNVSINGGSEYDTVLNSDGNVVYVSYDDDTINNTGSKVTIDGGVGDDSIDNSGSNVSISGGEGSNYINVNDGTGVTVNVSSGDDTIFISNNISSVTVKNFAENDVIQFSNEITTFNSVKSGVKADSITISGLTAATSTQQWSGTKKYIEKVTEGVSLSSSRNSLVYTPASTDTLFSISGITSTSKVTVDTENKVVTVGAGALTTTNVSISGDYTLVLGESIDAPTTTSGWSISGNNYAYRETSTIAGYELNSSGNQIIYTPATYGAILAQLNGLKDEPIVDENTIVLSADDFSSNVTVSSNANNYAFNLSEGSYSKKAFIATANADSIENSGSTISISSGKGDDYILNNNVGASVTILGGAGADSIKNNGSKVTILGGDDDDYIVNSGDNISINAGEGDNSISLNSGLNITIDVSSGNDTISLGDLTSLNVKNFGQGDVIELSKLADSLETVSGGITTGDITVKGITTLSTFTNEWSLKSGVATYYQIHTAGAKLSEDENAIIYTSAYNTDILTISGVTSTVGIDIDDTVVTVSESALGTSNVSISSGYKLELSQDVSEPTVTDKWMQSGTTYAYRLNSTIAGYELDRVNNVINYTATKGGTTVVELTHIDISDNAPTVSVGSIELSADSFSGNVSVKSNSGKYEFELGADSYSQKTFSGSSSGDSISNSGTALSINGGAGSDSISNKSTGSNVSISGGAGADTISNDADSVTIAGNAGNDSIGNWGDNVSINAGAGTDSIYNGGNNSTLLGGAANDYIKNDGGENILFQYQGGNDTINGLGSSDTLQIVSGSIAGAYTNGFDAFLVVGSNTITVEDVNHELNIMDSKGSVSSYTISRVLGTSGDDYLPNDNSNVSIEALAGNDDIDNFADSVTISGGADDDTIDSYGDEVSINGGAGNDSVNILSGTNLIINVSEGNDTISLKNEAASIKVEDFSSGDVITFADSIGALSSTSDGIIADNVTIAGLTAASISSAWSLGGSSANYIETYSTGVVLSQDKKSIAYKTDGEQSTLFTVSGVKSTTGLALEDLTIVVSSAALDQKNVTVNNGYNLSLGSDVTTPEFIDEGWSQSGNNYAYRTASTVAGYQLVSDSAINYFEDAGGLALVELSGVGSEPNVNENVVVLSADNFSGDVAVVSNDNNYAFELGTDDYEGKTFTGTTGADTISNSGSTIGIISGKGDDSIDNWGENVTVNAGNGDDYISNRGENTSINAGRGNDSIENYASSATISTGAGNDSITNDADNMLFQYQGGNDIVEGFNDSSTLQIVSGSISSAYVDGLDASITVGENTITLKNLESNKIYLMTADDTVASEYFIPLLMGTDDADYITNNNYSNLTIQALAADDTIENSGASVTVDGGDDNDLITNSSDATKSLLLGQAGNDSISNAADFVTISGGDGQDSITNTGSNVSISGGADNDVIELGTCSAATVNVADGNDTIVVDSNVSSFAVQKFTEGDRIELKVAATEITSIRGGIKVDDDLTITGLTASNLTNEWSLESGVAKYYQNRTAGVTLTDNNTAIVPTVASTSEMFTISGIASTVGIDVDDTTVTLSKSALGTSNVSISGGYSLALGEDVDAPEEVDESWHINGTTATYRDVSTLAGYTLEDNQIIYTAATLGKTFVELAGVSLPDDGEGIIQSNSVVLTASNFLSDVTVTNNDNDYYFELSEADYSGKSFIGTSGGELINNNYGSNVIINAGAGNDTIDNSGPSSTITAGNGDDSVYNRIYGSNVQITAGRGNDSIENDASYVNISGDAGNDYVINWGNSSTLDGGAGDDSINNTANALDMTISGGEGNDTIENNAEGAIISGGADNDSIYNAGDDATISGGTGNDTIELNFSTGTESYIEYSSGDGDDVVTLSNYNNGAKISVDLLSGSIGGYSTTEENDFVVQVDDGSLTFKDASGEIISFSTPEGKNYIFNGASNTSIGGGNKVNIIDNKGSEVTVQSGRGNDTVTLSADESSSNVYEFSKGKGKDVVYNCGDSDKIRISDDSSVKVKIQDDDIVLKVGTSATTLKDAAKNQQTITVVNSKDETILSDTYTTAGKINADATAIELAENFSGTYTAENDITTVDGSAVANKVNIIGNEIYGNSLIGSKHNDTLEGETLDDTLTGGKGKDFFVYKGGSDVITDYEKRDKIRLENDSPTVTSYAIEYNDLTLGFGLTDSLTIADGAGKVISLVEGKKTTRNIYTATGIFDGKEKSVSLSSSQSVFSAARYSKLVTIDGSNAADYMNITGNNKKNYIIGGGFGGTMGGGKGKDTLIASEGSDVFVYSKGDGKDVIESLGAGDVVSLGSDVTIKDAKIRRGNSEIKVASGSITINDTTTATLISDDNSIIFNNGAFIDRTNSVVKVYGSYKDDIELGSLGVTIADASEARRKLTITGTDSANSITGGKGKDSILGGAGADSLVGGKGKDSLWGGAGNDTLAGGKGNDLLYGDAGTDTFIFTAGDGIDTVAGYESGELLSIINKRGRAVDVSKSVFNESKGTFTLSVKGGGKLILTEVTSSTSVNINGTTKTISEM